MKGTNVVNAFQRNVRYIGRWGPGPGISLAHWSGGRPSAGAKCSEGMYGCLKDAHRCSREKYNEQILMRLIHYRYNLQYIFW